MLLAPQNTTNFCRTRTALAKNHPKLHLINFLNVSEVINRHSNLPKITMHTRSIITNSSRMCAYYGGSVTNYPSVCKDNTSRRSSVSACSLEIMQLTFKLSCLSQFVQHINLISEQLSSCRIAFIRAACVLIRWSAVELLAD